MEVSVATERTVLISVVLLVFVAGLAPSTPAHCQSPAADEPGDDHLEWIEYYNQRYDLDDLFAKRTDNRGDGFEGLYGTRNFRVILKGVAYRGGANNTWHRTNRRANTNPLPDDGLKNLCREGFGLSYYLYTTNFENAPELTTCQSPRSSEHELRYMQVSPNDEEQTYDVLTAIHETISDYRHGPIYLHCWNGWHASGLLAAKILRQFCGLSADEAVAYWDSNTDGNNKEARYESIRRRIRDFTPYPEFAISEREAALICP